MENSKKILIVDDDKDFLKALNIILEDKGYSIVTATEGAQALELARTESPSLILLDIMLPGMNGFKVCRFLKFDENYKDIPIIIISAKSDQEDKRLGKQMGAELYITKPFENGELLQAIKLAIMNFMVLPPAHT